MTGELESTGVRADWVLHLRNVQQAVIGDLVDGDLAGLRRAVRRMKSAVPPDENAAERLFVRQALLTFLDRCARELHTCFHVQFRTVWCHAVPPLEHEAQWLASNRSVPDLLDAWGSAYIDWFQTHHELPIVWRALEVLIEPGAITWTPTTLARALGCSLTVLVGQFNQIVGLSPAEYLARLRVREGLRYLRGSRATVEEAAMHAGYRSYGKFHRRVCHYTGATPAAVRACSCENFEEALDRWLPLKASTIPPRRLEIPARLDLSR